MTDVIHTALWVFSILNFFLLALLLRIMSLRFRQMIENRAELDEVMVHSFNQIIHLLGASAEHELLVAADLRQDRSKVRDVARDLSDRTKRADDTDDDPGSAADAASRSGDK